MASNNAPKGKPLPGAAPRNKGARVVSDEARAHIILLIVEGLDDYAINFSLIREGYLVKGEEITYRQMLRYRQLPESKPEVKHLNLRAQQLGCAAYSEVVINTILLGRAAIKALLTIDPKDGQPKMLMSDPDTVVSRSADGDEKFLVYDGKMIKALSDNHFRASDIVLKMFVPDVEGAVEEDIVNLRELAMVELAESIAERLTKRKADRDAKREANAGAIEIKGTRADFMELETIGENET